MSVLQLPHRRLVAAAQLVQYLVSDSRTLDAPHTKTLAFSRFFEGFQRRSNCRPLYPSGSRWARIRGETAASRNALGELKTHITT